MNTPLGELLQQRNITVYRLAKDTGVPISTIRGWIERGRKGSGDKLVKVADYLGVSVEYLMGMEKLAPETEDELIMKTITKIRRLPPELAYKAFEYVELLEMQLKNLGKR